MPNPSPNSNPNPNPNPNSNQARRGGAVVLYLVANAVDVLLALGLSYLCFSVWKVSASHDL